MINKLVVENVRHRPVRTLLSIVAIAVQVTMILTLVGLSRGMLDDQKRRARGVGADILVRAPGSSLLGLSTNMTAKYLPFVQKQPHVRIATGVLIQGIGGLNSVTGLDLDAFNAFNGGFRYIEGGPFKGPDEVIVDQYQATQYKQKLGDTIEMLNRHWKVVGVVEPGMLARVVVPLPALQELTANTGKVTVIYIKLDDPARTSEVVADLRKKLTDSPIYSMDEYVSLFSVSNVPMIKEFIAIVIGLGILVGFLVVFLSMYTAVLERTREIGVLKALGASPAYILNILLRETALLAVFGALLGILLTYGTRALIMGLIPGSLIQAIVPDWWPIAGALALGGALLGALYPGWKAARQDAIEALAYD